ncbi:thiamine diphosphokinase [Listeria ivanovii]|uniref:thiamine diphosphokinase n=1 Tax=Listeria ivanovii TaxID=1638 RepID=UPI000512779F|nr:thiamine diphosphokinase [Listeria ivanovii]AIS63045.1 thiamine pyrophosphokinase [Listeria ivanovii subsp. londoniensis]MBC2255203.1 thiamine diphosphokinase [Listeria ivanovii]MBK1966615.1 thiamine diphosphokinase [Listeria ivanovii subsp. londoniensis]MBK1984198.1 thiamine diphosphokinase [Listeria ivanovii subsp. londoniensis]MBK1996085.1 thiamine diphosphokinase [Listeria ivanovii subsp. londoniensis]
MKIINIMVGGPASELPDLEPYTNREIDWIGVDRGAKRLLDRGITPTIALGDFDSLTKEELADLKTKVTHVLEFPAEKDETDTEIGLSWAMDQNPDKIRIFGATGGRLDHLLANLMMLTKPRFQAAVPAVEMIDRYNYIKMYRPGSYTIEKLPDKKYVAFTTMQDVTGLTLNGFVYPLENATYPVGSALSSNEFLDQTGEFSFTSGMILLTQSND